MFSSLVANLTPASARLGSALSRVPLTAGRLADTRWQGWADPNLAGAQQALPRARLSTVADVHSHA